MPKVITTKRRIQEPLQDNERFILGIGLGFAFIFMVAMGALVWALKYSDATPDSTSAVAIAPDYPRRLIDFSLTDQTGRTVTRNDLAGKFVVVGFILSSCSITCPVVCHQMEEIQSRTAGQPDVRLLTLTVDPVDDTVPVLKQFSSRFGAEPSRWSFLTGDEVELRHLIGVSFLAPDTSGQFAYMPGNFAHIERIALVDPQGRIERYFNGLNEGAADAVVAEIERLKKTLP